MVGYRVSSTLSDQITTATAAATTHGGRAV